MAQLTGTGGFLPDHRRVLHNLHTPRRLHNLMHLMALRALPHLAEHGFILPEGEGLAVLAMRAGAFCKRFGEHYGITWVFAKSHCL